MTSIHILLAEEIIKTVRGQELALGAGIARTRVTLRFDVGLIHATTGNIPSGRSQTHSLSMIVS